MKPHLRIVVGSRTWRDETHLDQRPDPRYVHKPRLVTIGEPPHVPWVVVAMVAGLLAAASAVAWWLFA